MGFSNYPANYLLFNSKLSKNLALVLQIEGVPQLFGISETYTQIRYGDQGIIYGLPGVVYGGLRSLNTILPYIMLDGGLNIQQRIEPESGKGNIGQLTINLADYNGQVSYILAPGNVVPEIMGQLCRLWIGYADTSFPSDYVLCYQGLITSITCPPGKVTLQISDSSNKTRQPIFDISSTVVTEPIGPTDTIINVQTTSVLHQQILGPDGVTYDPAVSTYLEIDSEIMQYVAGTGGILNSTQVQVTRGVLGTAAASHDSDATVQGSVGFGYNSEGINCVEFALKTLLSGWGGPDFTDIPILSFVYDYQGNYVSNEFVLTSANDALLDLGLTPGDWFYITGSASGNSVSGMITGVTAGVNGQNTIIMTNQNFTLENPTNALVAFRSQYDTFPITCGVGCYTSEVDVAGFQSIQSTYFTAGGTSNLRGYYDSAVDGQDMIASDIMLPIGAYSISRYGRISMAITKPPLPGNNTKLVQLDWTNIIDPDKIQVTRSTNQRSFYNEISYEYDYDVANQTFNQIVYDIDTDSLENFGYTVALPIQAKTVSSALGGSLIAQNTSAALLTRYKQCLIWIELTVNWSVGSLLEVSDIVALVDNGNLKIMNFETGLRNLGVQLYEVIDRSYQIISGNVKLKLLGGLGFDLTSRFGLYSPSSIIQAGSSASNVRIMPSFGQTTLTNEIAKWNPLIGCHIQVHDQFYTRSASGLLVGLNPTDPAGLLISPPLSFAPPSGYILDIAAYPAATAAGTDAYATRLYAHYSKSIPVVTGTSPTQFSVAASAGSFIHPGSWVILHDSNYEVLSGQTTVSSVSGGNVVLKSSLTFDDASFTPDNTFTSEGGGYPDGTGSYLYS